MIMNFALDNSQYVKTFEKVTLVDRFNSQIKINGSIHLTPTHMMFIASEPKLEIMIYYSWIWVIDKQPLNTNGLPLLIKCKTFLNCLFIIQSERDCQALCGLLTKYSKPPKIEDLCCFLPNEHLDYLKDVGSCKKIFELEAEFMRMGLPNNEWSPSFINKSYQICDTYPNLLYVPNTATTAVLQASASFRSRGRLPVLSYLHHNGASICRCSQPLSGFSARCVEDEQLLDCILRTNKTSKFMYVVDTRPRINALANKAQGKGYENENNYSNIQFYFFGIENIHVMRSSLQKYLETLEASNLTTTQYLSGIDKSDWLKHIKIILETANFITDAINDQNINVIVHCSDGWDRTAQTCALASLLLDPYYRTIHGYQVLIEKEWLMFGHKFNDRYGHTDVDAKETSPIFTQFLECTWQLTQQFPCAFEFNEVFLIKIHDHVHSCQFGTFIGNCEKDRVDLKLSDRTFSLWHYMQSNINDYFNPLYVPYSPYSKQVLRADIRLQALKVWKGMYNRFDRGVNQRENAADMLVSLKDHTISLEDHVKLLEKRIDELKLLVSTKNMKIDGEESKKDDADPNSTNGGKITPDLTLDQLALELNSVSLDWKSIRNPFACNCPATFDYMAKKKTCWRCSEIYCYRCVDNLTVLPGHYSASIYATVCKNCRITMKSSPSYVNFDAFTKTKSMQQICDNKQSINNSDYES